MIIWLIIVYSCMLVLVMNVYNSTTTWLQWHMVLERHWSQQTWLCFCALGSKHLITGVVQDDWKCLYQLLHVFCVMVCPELRVLSFNMIESILNWLAGTLYFMWALQQRWCSRRLTQLQIQPRILLILNILQILGQNVLLDQVRSIVIVYRLTITYQDRLER